MTLTYKAPYPQPPYNTANPLATAGITLDATTTDATQAVTAGADGARLVGAAFMPMETISTAAPAWLFISTDGGSTFRPISGLDVAAITISATSAPEATPFQAKGANISQDNAIHIGASHIIAFGYATAMAPASIGHACLIELEDF